MKAEVEELVKKINANYLALYNLENLYKNDNTKNENKIYLDAKQHVEDSLHEKLIQYKQLTNKDFELSNELKTVLGYGE